MLQSLRTNLRWTILPALAAVLLLRPVATRADEAVAIVNGEKIMESVVIAELKARWGFAVREQLITAAIVNQEAKKKGITVTEAEVDTALKTTKSDIESRYRATGQSFTEWLIANQYTLVSYRSFLRTRLLLEKMVKPEVKVTDDDVSKYYEATKNDLMREEAIEVAFIGMATKEEADKVRLDLIQGKLTWEEAAKQHNLDPYGRDNGGYFGFIRKGDQKLQVAAFALTRDGDLSQPFEDAPHGWIIVKRLSYQPPGMPKFEEIKDDIRESLTIAVTQRLAEQLLESLLIVNKGTIQRLGDIVAPVVQ